MKRDIKYKCKYCNQWLEFKYDNYVCPVCGLIYNEESSINAHGNIFPNSKTKITEDTRIG